MHPGEEETMNPWVKNPWAIQNPGPYREGDRVRFLFGTAKAEGVIVEDRGNLGVNEARLYGIKFRLDDVSDEMYIELPIEDFELIPPATPSSGNGQAE
jgi:hypothetical protein